MRLAGLAASGVSAYRKISYAIGETVLQARETVLQACEAMLQARETVLQAREIIR